MAKMPKKVVITEPYDKLPGETQRNYSYFLEYCKLGPSRTIEKLQEITKKSPATLWTISSENNWKERARAFDNEQNRIFFAEMRKQAQQGATDVYKLGRALQSKAVESLMHHDLDVGKEGKRIPLSEVPKWAELGTRIVKMALELGPGDPDIDGSDGRPHEDMVALVLEVMERFPDAKKALLEELERIEE